MASLSGEPVTRRGNRKGPHTRGTQNFNSKGCLPPKCFQSIFLEKYAIHLQTVLISDITKKHHSVIYFKNIRLLLEFRERLHECRKMSMKLELKQLCRLPTLCGKHVTEQ